MRSLLILSVFFPLISFTQTKIELGLGTGLGGYGKNAVVSRVKTSLDYELKFSVLSSKDKRAKFRFETGFLNKNMKYRRYESFSCSSPMMQRCTGNVYYAERQVQLKLYFGQEIALFKSNKIWYSLGGLVPIFEHKNRISPEPKIIRGWFANTDMYLNLALNLGYKRELITIKEKCKLDIYGQATGFFVPQHYAGMLMIGIIYSKN